MHCNNKKFHYYKVLTQFLTHPRQSIYSKEKKNHTPEGALRIQQLKTL